MVFALFGSFLSLAPLDGFIFKINLFFNQAMLRLPNLSRLGRGLKQRPCCHDFAESIAATERLQHQNYGLHNKESLMIINLNYSHKRSGWPYARGSCWVAASNQSSSNEED